MMYFSFGFKTQEKIQQKKPAFLLFPFIFEGSLSQINRNLEMSKIMEVWKLLLNTRPIGPSVRKHIRHITN